MTLRFLIQKEFLQLRRNAFLPRLVVVFPILIMCVMPWVMNQEVKNIRVCVVDNKHTTQSSRLVHSLEASPYFIFTGMQPSYEAAIGEIEHSRADIAVVVSDKVLIAANAVNGTKGSIGSAYLTQTVASIYAPRSASVSGIPVVMDLYNKHNDYKMYMIPALFAIIIMLMCGFLPALNIVGEKEQGTIEQINVTPVSRLTFIFAKLIPYWIIALFIITVCLVLAWAVYGYTCQGNVLLIYLLVMLLALFFSSLGLVVSNYSSTMQQAIFVMWFFVVLLMLLSGLFTPTRSMPHWAYMTTYVNPMHYFIDAIRTVFLRGGGLASIGRQVLALGGFALLFALWAVRSYRKNS